MSMSFLRLWALISRELSGPRHLELVANRHGIVFTVSDEDEYACTYDDKSE